MLHPLLRRTTCVATLLALIVLISSAAQAGVYSFNDNFSFALSPGSQVVNLPQWDPTLYPGESLDSVQLTISGTIAADVTAENDSGIAGNITVDLTGLLQGSGPDLSAIAAILTSVGPVAVAATDGTPDSGPDFHDFGTISQNGSDDDTTGIVGPFIGNLTIPITVNGNGGFAVGGVTDSTLKISNFGASGLATITYFTSAVPEPSSIVLALLGASVCGLGVWRKRRK